MRFLFAPDSFKGTLTALDAAKRLDQAARRHFPGLETILVPIADGGEGTVEAIVLATGGRYEHAWVTGPLGGQVQARYGLLPDGETAVLEMAQASGLPLVPEGQRNPLHTSTFGTGEMLLHAIRGGAKRLLLGIGGSATNDGGMGMLAALGVRFYDVAGAPIKPCGASLGQVARVDWLSADAEIFQAEITVICDVTNPLLGAEGATAIYGPQKGADANALEALEAGMTHYAKVMQHTLGRDIAAFPGAGAAGGLGAALGGGLGATLRSGIDAVLETVGFDALLSGVDLVVTGEGRLDGQSVRFRKVPAGVAQRCGAAGIPVIALVGGMAEGAEALYELAEASVMTTINAAMPIETALAQAEPLFDSAADRLFRMLAIGKGLAGR